MDGWVRSWIMYFCDFLICHETLWLCNAQCASYHFPEMDGCRGRFLCLGGTLADEWKMLQCPNQNWSLYSFTLLPLYSSIFLLLFLSFYFFSSIEEQLKPKKKLEFLHFPLLFLLCLPDLLYPSNSFTLLLLLRVNTEQTWTLSLELTDSAAVDSWK